MRHPEIDKRSMEDLVRQMKQLAPFYTPEWRFSPEDPDPGAALFHLFSEMYAGNLKRLNRVPYKNFIAYLNLLEVEQLPPKPASAYVTFKLSEGAMESVWIPAGTRVSAPPPPGEENELVYETASPMLVTPAQIADLFLVNNAQDAVVRKEKEQFEPYSCPADQNLQEHVLYVAHEDVLHILGTSVIQLEIKDGLRRYMEQEHCTVLSDPSKAEWMYSSAEGWQAFDQVESAGNRIRLYKEQAGEISRMELGGEEGRWLACRLRKGAITDSASGLRSIHLTSLQMNAEYWDAHGAGGLEPDRMFFNDVEVTNHGFYPFGEYFAAYGTFYLSSREAFSKKKAMITLSFLLKSVPNEWVPDSEPSIDWKLIMRKSKLEKPEPQKVSILKVIWEYWNGAGWVKMNTEDEAEVLFYYPKESEKTIRFRCPEDLRETVVNAQDNYWIRARILNVENIHSPDPIFLSPYIENVKLCYEYGESYLPPDACKSGNNLEYRDHTASVRYSGEPFAPFVQPDCPYPSLLMGFDSIPLRGPVSLYVSMGPNRFTTGSVPVIEWEYLRKEGASMRWEPLKTADDTDRLTRSGSIRFAGPDDMARAVLLGEERYWIRAANRDRRLESPVPGQPSPVIEGLHLNTVMAVQMESVPQEIPERRSDGLEPYYVLSRTPVLEEKVWVDETGQWTDHELEQMAVELGDRLDVIRDSSGNPTKVWVRWTPVPHLHHSDAGDRHYTIDRARGVLRFGDGKRGMKPPLGGDDKVKASYRVTAGRKGNVGRMTIRSLHHSIAFIQGVENPEPAGGGTDMEQVEEAVRRGPQLLKHRHRAVTAEDYEWLAREAYPNIAKVKCLPNINARLEREAGCITLVVLSKEGTAGGSDFPAMKRAVESSLLAQAAGVVAFSDQLQVIAPVFLEVSLAVTLVVGSMEAAVQAETEALAKLADFLDPLRGGYDGQGWGIGQQLHPSVFYPLLISVRSASNVEKLSMSVHRVEDGRRDELTEAQLKRLAHGVMVNGSHRISIRVSD